MKNLKIRLSKNTLMSTWPTPSVMTMNHKEQKG